RERCGEPGTDGHTTGAAGTSPEDAAAANVSTRVRQGGPAVLGRECGLSALPAAYDGAGTVGPRAASYRAPHPAGTLPGGQDLGHFRVPEHPVCEQGPGAGT